MTGESVADALGRRLWPLDAGLLLEQTRRRTGLEDFGDPPPEPALTALLQSLDREADLHPLGRLLMRLHIADLLTTRLRLAAAWQQRATVDTAPITRPLFITGMPRSGSTFLHALLAADPCNRAPRAWEVMFPLPARDHRSDWRIRRAAADLWWFRRLAPAADAVHPIRADSPQECIIIHSYTFLSEEFLATCAIPSYEAWMRSADFAPTYAWQRRFLQHLQGAAADRRWVLKSPDHANTLAALMTVFPDAVIVQTHRAPAEVLTSCLELVEVLHGVFARRRHYEERARREARALADAMDRLLRFREMHPELVGRFIDISYAELVADPLAAVRRIYAHWEAPLTPAAAAAMRRLVAERSRYAKGRFISDLARLGEGLEAELARFDRYCARFGI